MRPGPLLELQADYAKRIGRDLEIHEVEEKRKLTPAELTLRESERLLAVLPENAYAVALDERGKSLPSAGLAERLGAWRQMGRPVAFLIGGADGHHPQLRERADLLLALGPMTWPHLLARIMLLEQLYRAQQILAGHPYHRA